VYSQFGLRSAKTAQRALNYPALRRTLDQASRANLALNRLPAELLARVAGKSLGNFPVGSVLCRRKRHRLPAVSDLPDVQRIHSVSRQLER
jgi:hypothetical protein